jgi:hypothetical protein
MSQIIDIDEFRAQKKPTALSATLMLVNERGFSEFQKEVLAPFKNVKGLENSIFGALQLFNLEYQNAIDFTDIDSATDFRIIEGGPNSKEQKFSLEYTFSGFNITIYFRIYTYGLNKTENAEVYKMLHHIRIE